MRTYTSILSSKIISFLTVRQASEGKGAYAHDEQIQKLLDLYLYGIDCNSKKLNEQQVTDWVDSLTGKTSSVVNKVIIVRKFFHNLSGAALRHSFPVFQRYTIIMFHLFFRMRSCAVFSVMPICYSRVRAT